MNEIKLNNLTDMEAIFAPCGDYNDSTDDSFDWTQYYGGEELQDDDEECCDECNHIAPNSIKIDDLDFNDLDETTQDIIIPFKDKSRRSMVSINAFHNAPAILVQAENDGTCYSYRLGEEVSRKIRERLQEELPWYFH